MIEFPFFAYTDKQLADINTALGHDADQIGYPITPFNIGQHSITGMEPLRSRIEIAASLYLLHSATNRPRREELDALRKDVDNLRASIFNAVAVPVGIKGGPLVHPLLLYGVDADMLTATERYFTKVRHNLDRIIEQTGSSRDNARKTTRDQFWNELLAIWCELGGKQTGKATANFLIAASKPVMGSAIPTFASVTRWLNVARTRPPARSPSRYCAAPPSSAASHRHLRQTSPVLFSQVFCGRRKS